MKVTKSAAVRHPCAPAVAVIQVSTFDVFVRPVPVRSVSASVPSVNRFETRRFVDVAFVVVPFTTVSAEMDDEASETKPEVNVANPERLSVPVEVKLPPK